jgi:hypothetical protein
VSSEPDQAATFVEELKQVAASIDIDFEIDPCEKDKNIGGVDIILVFLSLLTKLLLILTILLTPKHPHPQQHNTAQEQ